MQQAAASASPAAAATPQLGRRVPEPWRLLLLRGHSAVRRCCCVGCQVVSPFNAEGLLSDWDITTRLWQYALK